MNIINVLICITYNGDYLLKLIEYNKCEYDLHMTIYIKVW